MSNVIAIVKSLIGQVVALSPEGVRRQLFEGDRIYKGDQLVTGSEGEVSLALTDGGTVDVGRDSQWSDTQTTSSEQAQPAATDAKTAADEQLIQAINAGLDPTTDLEATAAGSGSGSSGGASGGGNHSFVLLDATGARLDPTVGYPTGPRTFSAASDGIEPAGSNDSTEPNAPETPIEPPVTPTNGAPTIVVTANNLVEGTATAGNVAATYVASDEEDAPADLVITFTGTSNSAGYYALVGGQVVLTAAGAAHVNAGGTLPAVQLTVTDTGALTGNGSATPDVALVNDAPSGTDKTITTLEDTAYTLTEADFGFSDANDTPADAFTNVIINVPSSGTLSLAGTAIIAPTTVSLADIQSGKLVFTPAPDASGIPYSNISFQVQDDGGTANGGQDTDQSPNTITFNVTPVNDATSPTVSVSTTGQWLFNNANGATTTSNSTTGQTGILADDNATDGSAIPTFTTGRNSTAGNAINFNDVGDRVDLNPVDTSALMGTSSMTFWIKTTQVGVGTGAGNTWDQPAVLGSEQNGGVNDIQWGAINNEGKIGFGIANEIGVFSTTSINDNVWHNIAITRDSSTKLVSIYVDGRLEATGSPNDGGFDATLNRLLALGVNNQFSNDAAGTDLADTRYFQGALDDLRIYNSVLTQDQVTAIRNVENGFQDTALANDGQNLKFSITNSLGNQVAISGLEVGMTLSDGIHSETSIGNQQSIDLAGWNLSNLTLSNTGTASATLAITATNTHASGDTASTTDYLTIANGQSVLSAGTSGVDNLTGSAGADLLRGGDGNDTLNGGAGNDRLEGGNDNDSLLGEAGNDILLGGAGDDTLWGGAGADNFIWKASDLGNDVIKDFNIAEGDRIDLHELLQGENDGNILHYLRVDTATSTLEISSSGGFGADGIGGVADTTIKLENGGNPVDLSAYGATSSQIIGSMIAGDLVIKVDHSV